MVYRKWKILLKYGMKNKEHFAKQQSALFYDKKIPFADSAKGMNALKDSFSYFTKLS